jgi:hypothetical protein
MASVRASVVLFSMGRKSIALLLESYAVTGRKKLPNDCVLRYDYDSNAILLRPIKNSLKS